MNAEEREYFEQIARNTRKWLEEEDSIVRRFEKALDEHDLAVAKELGEKLITQYGYVKQFHARFAAAIAHLALEGLAENYQREIQRLQRQVLALQTRLDQEVIVFRQLLDENEWVQLRGLIPQLEQAIEEIVNVDHDIVSFEVHIYEQDANSARVVRRFMREITRHPEHLVRERTRDEMGRMLQDPIQGPLLLSKLRLAYLTLSLTAKTAMWVLFIWGVIQLKPHVTALLQPTTHHTTTTELGVALNNTNFIQDWLDSLSDKQRRRLLKTHLKTNQKIVDQEYYALLNAVANQLYDHVMDQVYQGHQELVKRIKAKGSDTVDVSKINNYSSKKEMETALLAQMRKTKAKILADIAEHLRQYYPIDLLVERLPTPKGLLAESLNGNWGQVWHHLKWGAAHPNRTIKTEDEIRRDLNKLLEPYVNEVKERVLGTVLGGDVWKETQRTINHIFTKPSEAMEALKALYERLKEMGMAWMAIAVAITLAGGFGITWKFGKIFIWNYFRDIFIVLRDVKRRWLG